MTAIGFIFLLIGIAIGWLDDCFYLPEMVEVLSSILILLGIIFMAYGIAFWLWKVMP